MVAIKRQNALYLLLNTQILYYRVYSITDHGGDGFYGLVTLMFHVNPPPMFSRIKFSKISGAMHE
jgi:hypothetical protein